MKITDLNSSIINPNVKLKDIGNEVATNKINFSDILTNSIQKVSDDQIYAEQMDELFAIGEVDNIHDVTIAAMKADLSINYAVEITNKVLSAYSEIMRLQL